MTSLLTLNTYNEPVTSTNVNEFYKDEIQEEIRQEWSMFEQEYNNLYSTLAKAQLDNVILNRKLFDARRQSEEEKRRRRTFERKANALHEQITIIRDFLFNNDDRKFSDEAREKLQFLHDVLNHQINIYMQDTHIDQVNTTGSILSSLGVLSTTDDSDMTILQNHNKLGLIERYLNDEYCIKQCHNIMHQATELNSSDKIPTTTTEMVVPKDGTITISSIEAISDNESTDSLTLCTSRKRCKSNIEHKRSKLSYIDSNEVVMDTTSPVATMADLSSSFDAEDVSKLRPSISEYILYRKMFKSHNFKAKAIKLKKGTCTICGKSIQFYKIVQKCKDCKIMTHTECKNLMPPICNQTGNMPIGDIPAIIDDCMPITLPMIPSLVVHCVNEIELRGMNEQDLYRTSARYADIKSLKKAFLKSKDVPNLVNIDIPTLCCTLKNFLRSNKPLIIDSLWQEFVHTTTLTNKQDINTALYRAISQLPQLNQDTLAFLMLHLQKVSSNSKCEMSISNLAVIFGPILVGYKCPDQSFFYYVLNNREHQIKIVENLLQIPSNYYCNMINSQI